MQQRHQKHLQAYLEAWTDAAFDHKADPDWNDGAVNEELAAIEACLSSFAQAWPQNHDSNDATTDLEFCNSGSDETSNVQLTSASPKEGDLVGRFRLQEQLGTGGMGIVFLAVDTVLRRRVALKIPVRRQEAEQFGAERFQREAEAAARLRHANVVGVLESGSDQGVNYIVSELIEGPDLKRWLAESDHSVNIICAASVLVQINCRVSFLCC